MPTDTPLVPPPERRDCTIGLRSEANGRSGSSSLALLEAAAAILGRENAAASERVFPRERVGRVVPRVTLLETE